MCLTQDGLPWSHTEQARRLCSGGARWIQVRIKNLATPEWIHTAREIAKICREYDVLCVINDSVEVALAADADGVHLGKNDLGWIEARRLLGPGKILGGTVNDLADAERATASNVLDYVGIGPWRFTKNKINLAPILGASGIASLLPILNGIPAWAIGAIESSDLADVKAIGCAGAAVSSAIFRDGEIEKNVAALHAKWSAAMPVRNNLRAPRLSSASTL